MVVSRDFDLDLITRNALTILVHGKRRYRYTNSFSDLRSRCFAPKFSKSLPKLCTGHDHTSLHELCSCMVAQIKLNVNTFCEIFFVLLLILSRFVLY